MISLQATRTRKWDCKRINAQARPSLTSPGLEKLLQAIFVLFLL